MDKPFPAYVGDASYIFVSYAHADADIVYPEISWLHEQGFNVWYDEGIEPGSVWRDELAKAIAGASVFLFFATPTSVERPHCRREVDFAVDREMPIITVYLQPTELPGGMQLSLSSVQAVFKYEEKAREYRRKLVAFASEHTGRGISATTPVEGSAGRSRFLSTTSALIGTVVLAAGFLLGVLSTSYRAPEVAPNETLRRIVPRADVDHDTRAPTFAISDSGSHIAFISAEHYARQARLFVWDRTAFDPVEIGLDGDNPFNLGLSPDGQWVVYRSLFDGDLKRVPVAGGSATTISRAVTPNASASVDRGIAWAKDSIFIANRSPAIQRVLIRDGQRTNVTSPPTGLHDSNPEYLKEQDALLFDRINHDSDHHVLIMDLETSIETTIVAGRNPQFVQGNLLFEKDNRIWGAPLDTTTWTLGSEPKSLLDNASAFDVSSNGDVLYAGEDLANAARTLVLATETEGETPIPNLPPGRYRDPLFSPDGSEIAFVRGNERGEGDLYVLSVDDFSVRRLTNDPRFNSHPTWSPDGRELLFASFTGTDQTDRQLLKIAGHGLDDPEALPLQGFFVPTAWTGEELFYTDVRTVSQISALNLKSGETRTVFESRYVAIRAALSPNQRFLAYMGIPGDRFETFVRPVPATDSEAYQLTQSDRTHPIWSRSRDDILYCRHGLDVVELTLDFDDGVRVSSRRVLFERPPYPPSGSRWNYDVDANGRFVFVKYHNPRPPQLAFIQNWLPEIEAVLERD